MQLAKQQAEVKDKASALFLLSTLYLFGLMGIIPEARHGKGCVSIYQMRVNGLCAS
jgi:hypothetical protein